MKKLFLLLLIYIGFTNFSISQVAVVSEVYYGAGPSNEWSEILVVQDRISMVGYSIRDNSGSDGWQGGVKFRDVDLWKNLREGTIIIINHRGGVVDDDKSDGYIEIGAESNFYFERFFGPGQGGDWATAGNLDLNSSYDMIQLRNNLDNHVHCLGFIGGQIGDNYDTIPKPNIFLNSGITQNRSVMVAPGLDISNYNAGISPANISMSPASGDTKGRPNKRNTNDFQNQAYWRELRQPSWTNPGVINTRIVDNFSSIELKWNAASTFSDPNEGYMILRYIDNDNVEPIIDDGKIYAVGQNIGPYKVVGLVPLLTTSEFLDKFTDGEQFSCGKKYGYRIYAYRYQSSNIEDHRVSYDYTDPRNARGRQYNEATFASVSQAIVKEIPPTPEITNTIGITKFCSNVSAKLESNIKDTQKYFYSWFADNVQLTEAGTALDLSKPGIYYLVITNKSSGCTARSNDIKIEILEAPDAYIFEPATNKTFNRDTTITLCTGQKLDVRGVAISSNPDKTNIWYKDGAEFSRINDISIIDGGIYKFVSIAGGICPDTSITMTVRFVNPNFVLSETNLLFDADNSPEKDVVLTNNSDDDLILNSGDFIITPQNNFKIISPTVFPITIPKNGTLTIKIRFEIVGFGEQTGRFTVRSICNFTRIVDLKGARVDVGVTRLDPDIVDLDLGYRAAGCTDFDYGVDSIRFISSGTDDLIVLKPTFGTANFSFVCDDFNANNSIIVKPGGSFGGYVKVETAIVGEYIDELTVRYVPKGKKDTSVVRVVVRLNLYDPSITVLTKKIDVSNEVTCKKTLDTFIVVINETLSEITIDNNISDTRVSITDILPKIIEPGKTDSIAIRLNFTDKSTFNFDFSYQNPCSLISEKISITPPSVDLDVEFANDTIDFGIINNCFSQGDVSLSSKIIASADGAFIGRMIYGGTQVSSSLFTDKLFSSGENNFEVKVLANADGFIKDSIVFEVEPCGEIYVLYIIGERLNPSRPVFSTNTIDFGSSNIFDAETRTLTIINENAEFEIVIDSLQVPQPFELVNPTIAEFPVTIQPSGTLDIEITYKRLNVGNHNELLRIYMSKPCKQDTMFIIRGATIDDRLVIVKVSLPENEFIEIGSEKRIPINVQFDPKYSIAEIELRTMTFYLSFDYINLNLRTAINGPAVNSLTSILNFDDSQQGKLKLTLNVANPDNITNGDMIYVTVKPLLGDALEAKIILDSVKINSKMPTSVETNESDITITGDCDLEGRLLAVTGAVSISVRETDASSSIRINYSTISDEQTNIYIYNYLGELVDKVVDGYTKPGEYSMLYDTNRLPVGVYNFILTNGMRIETCNYPILR